MSHIPNMASASSGIPVVSEQSNTSTDKPGSLDQHSYPLTIKGRIPIAAWPISEKITDVLLQSWRENQPRKSGIAGEYQHL